VLVGWRGYGLVLTSAVACYCALGAVLGILPGYVSSGLGASPVWVGICVGAPALTGAALRPVGGRLADRGGPRRVMILGAGAMTAGTLPAFAPSLPALVLSRLAVGAGEALMMSAAVLWLLRLAGPSRQALALGHIGLANYVGLTIGPLVAIPLGGPCHPAAVWTAALALPLVAAAAVRSTAPPAVERAGDDDHARQLWRSTARPGIGLLLVNVGYIALLAFGAATATQHHLGLAPYVVPIFAGGVVASRTLLGAIPDRVGPGRTLFAAALVEGASLGVFAASTSVILAVVFLVTLSLGQGLAVPSLGALALRGVPAHQRGAAAGAFFAYFDAGVGLGGPFTGVLTHAFSAPVAVAVSGAAVTLAVPTALSGRQRTEEPYPGGADESGRTTHQRGSGSRKDVG
jgi:MFS family permease